MMLLSKDEVIVLYSFFQKNGWVDRDWVYGDSIRELLKRVTRNYEGLNLMSGIQFTEPSLDLQTAIHKSVQTYFTDLDSQGKTGGLFTTTSLDPNGKVYTNAVIAVKVGDHLEVAGYIGKEWGTSLKPDYGMEAKVVW